MAGPVEFEYPEPVPSISQLCALPFVASVAGYLTVTQNLSRSRATLHRVMTRDGKAYFQQLCSYAGQEIDHSKSGRLFAVSEGIIGKAYSECAVMRTRHLRDDDEWWTNYRADRRLTGDTRKEAEQVVSFLAVPLLDKAGKSALCVLYVEADGLNVFTTGEALKAVLGMCDGFCRLLDEIDAKPLPRLRNYPLPAGTPYIATPTVFPTLQEAVKTPSPPQFKQLTSFNFAPSP